MPFMRIFGVGGPWVRGKSYESIPVGGAVPDGHARDHLLRNQTLAAVRISEGKVSQMSHSENRRQDPHRNGRASRSASSGEGDTAVNGETKGTLVRTEV